MAFDRYKEKTTSFEVESYIGPTFIIRFFCDDSTGTTYTTKPPTVKSMEKARDATDAVIRRLDRWLRKFHDKFTQAPNILGTRFVDARTHKAVAAELSGMGAVVKRLGPHVNKYVSLQGIGADMSRTAGDIRHADTNSVSLTSSALVQPIWDNLGELRTARRKLQQAIELAMELTTNSDPPCKCGGSCDSCSGQVVTNRSQVEAIRPIIRNLKNWIRDVQKTGSITVAGTQADFKRHVAELGKIILALRKAPGFAKRAAELGNLAGSNFAPKFSQIKKFARDLDKDMRRIAAEEERNRLSPRERKRRGITNQIPLVGV